MIKEELEELKNKIKTNPADAETLRKLGWFYLKNHYYKRAHEEYNLAVNFNPRLISEIILDHERLIEKELECIPLRLSLVSFLLNRADVDTAQLELEELLEVAPQNIAIYTFLGKIYVKQNKIDQALSLLEKAHGLGIKDIGISQLLASVYLEKGRYEEAITFFEELVNQSPESKNILRTMGELYTRIGKLNQAAEAYNKLFILDHESAAEVANKLEALLIKDETAILAREILADIYMKSLKPDRAAEKLNEILLLSPDKIDFVIEKNKRILKNYPNHPQALLTLAQVLVEKGNFSEAIENFEYLIKNNPDNTAKAIEGCKRILQKYPGQYLARQFLAEVYLREEKYGEALEEIKQLLELSKDAANWVLNIIKDHLKKEPLLLLAAGRAHLKNENFEKASFETEKLLAYKRDNAPGYVLLGLINLKKNLSRRAHEAFESARRLNPTDKSIHALLKEAHFRELALEEESLKKRILEDEYRFSLHFELAKVYVKMERREEAIKELQIAARDQQRAPYVFNMMVELYIEEGRFNLAQSVINNYAAETREEFQPILKKIRYNMACCYEAQGNIKKAIKILEGILSTDLLYPHLYSKIKFLKESNLKSLQNKMLVVAILDPNSKKFYAMWGREFKTTPKRQNITASFGQSHNNSGVDYYNKGMLKAALEEFDLASKIDPSLTPAASNLGTIYLLSFRHGEAIQKFKDALRIDPASSIILNNLGLAYFLEGNADEALKYLEQAAALNPELAAAAINLGDIAYQKGEVEKALDAYKKVLPYDLLYPLAQKRLLYKQT